MVPRSLAPDTPLRGPRVAFGRLFGPGVSSCPPPRLGEGQEGRLVGILGGAGVCNLPLARDSLKTPAEWEATPLPQNPTKVNAACEDNWQLELLVPGSTRRNALNAGVGTKEELD